eukprot:TRINITY_DN27160_c0_g11_i1.p1 TRINITY_DN27160_c0_g11~~TRINITY_DN27160_c0_g11_i1.p1  ORF type:complete len:409 (-),score=101.48 TRINITY_DN27160_c0_g11_i1:87-1244(-)
MAAPSVGSQDDAAAEDICAGCNRSPLDVSLVLVCNHRLCLDCAAGSLRAVVPGFATTVSPEDCEYIAACPLCGVMTDVDPSAARHLREHSSAVSPRTSGIVAGVGAAGAQSLPIVQQPQAQPVPMAQQAPSEVAHRAPSPAPAASAAFVEAGISARENYVLSPDEHLQFFCMDCESDCMTAESAVEAARAGRDVVNARKAYQTLHKQIDRTLDGLQLRSEETQQAREEADAVKSDLDKIISKGRQSMQNMFRQLHADLAQKEAELLENIDSLEAVAGRELSHRATPVAVHSQALQEARGALRKIDPRDEEVQALNAYAAVRGTIVGLVDPQAGVDATGLNFLLDSVRSELRSSLEQQVMSVAAISDQVHEIRRSGAAPGVSIAKA